MAAQIREGFAGRIERGRIRRLLQSRGRRFGADDGYRLLGGRVGVIERLANLDDDIGKKQGRSTVPPDSSRASRVKNPWRRRATRVMRRFARELTSCRTCRWVLMHWT
jgi:hypothetical protein